MLILVSPVRTGGVAGGREAGAQQVPASRRGVQRRPQPATPQPSTFCGLADARGFGGTRTRCSSCHHRKTCNLRRRLHAANFKKLVSHRAANCGRPRTSPPPGRPLQGLRRPCPWARHHPAAAARPHPAAPAAAGCPALQHLTKVELSKSCSRSFDPRQLAAAAAHPTRQPAAAGFPTLWHCERRCPANSELVTGSAAIPASTAAAPAGWFVGPAASRHVLMSVASKLRKDASHSSSCSLCVVCGLQNLSQESRNTSSNASPCGRFDGCQTTPGTQL